MILTRRAPVLLLCVLLAADGFKGSVLAFIALGLVILWLLGTEMAARGRVEMENLRLRRAFDLASERLKELGWSTGAAQVITPAGVLWQVDASKGKHMIVAKAPGQTEAWEEAARLAEAVEGRRCAK